MRILHTTKSNPTSRTVIDENNALEQLKNNTVITIFEILWDIEWVALNADYYWDFVKKEVSKDKKYVGSYFISKSKSRKTTVESDKMTKLLDKKLRNWDIDDLKTKFLMNEAKKAIKELVSK